LRRRVSHDFGIQPGRLEAAQCLVIERDPAWIINKVLQSLQHQYSDAVLPEKIGKGQPGGASTDDDDVEVEIIHRPSPPTEQKIEMEAVEFLRFFPLRPMAAILHDL
jgi:hypothetical protein